MQGLLALATRSSWATHEEVIQGEKEDVEADAFGFGKKRGYEEGWSSLALSDVADSSHM